jgi:quercetin dioxygenase-like cupin family protein
MPNRAADWSVFLSLAKGYIDARSASSEQIAEVAARIFAICPMSTPASTGDQASQLPACQYLPSALDNARAHLGGVDQLASAFSAIAPTLPWQTRAGAAEQGPAFLAGHANAILTSVPPAEATGGMQIGVSLMAPHTQYPKHQHPPDEIYVVLSEGEWFTEPAGWFTPGIGNLVYNPSGTIHAMRSGDRPLLALWFLAMQPEVASIKMNC